MKAVAAFLLVLSYLSVSHGWICREAPQHFPTEQIDAGLGKVVLRDRNYYPYFLSGSTWYRLGTHRLKHVTVGSAGIWGVDLSNRVYKYVGGNFVEARGLSLQQVDAGGSGQIVGSTYGSGYCLRNTYVSSLKQSSTVSWNSLSRSLRYISCGKYGCWAVDTSYQVYFTQSISPSSCSTSTWTYVPGISAKMVEAASDGSVFAVSTSGVVYQRTSIYSGRPQGYTWSSISMCVRANHVSYDLGNLWVVSQGGIILRCYH